MAIQNWSDNVLLVELADDPQFTDDLTALLETVESGKDQDVVLTFGSDDGVKAWLNGAVVHGNNLDRGLVADQDTADIRLRKGTNDLMLKVTQGGGGWAVCARIVGVDGRLLPGLRTGPAATSPK